MKDQKAVTMRKQTLVVIILGIMTFYVTSLWFFSNFWDSLINEGRVQTIAIDLASEGIETIDDIIDFNNFFYRDRQKECWNVWINPDFYPLTLKCEGDAQKIEEGFYKLILSRDASASYDVSPPYEWLLSKNNSVQKELKDLHKDNDLSALEDFEVTDRELQWSPRVDKGSLYFLEEKITFYRQLFISYEDGNDDGKEDIMNVRSLVTWIEKGKIKDFQLIMIFTN